MSEPLISRPFGDRFERRTRICLNMIVKDESPVIERCLRSVKDIVDYYVIVDTGSSDSTPELIQRVTQELGLPGEVHFRDWVNFGHNRQQALDLAVAAGRGDWLLFIDADEELVIAQPRTFAQLEAGVTYQIEKRHGNIRYRLRNLIWVRDLRWQWHGVVHEYITPERKHRGVALDGAWILYHSGEGVRSRGLTEEQKFLRDATLLEAELRAHPNDTRSRFYLAQSYRDAGHYGKAYENYERRVAMGGGWAEETYIAQCEKAKLAIRLSMEHRDIVAEHLKAYSLRPTRAEALWQLAAYCRASKRYAEGYLFAKVGKDIPLPADILAVRRDVHDWRLLDDFCICAYWIGQYREAAEAGQRMLDEGLYAPRDRERIEKNLEYARAKL